MLKRLSLRYKIGFIAVIGFIGFFIYQAANYRLSLEISEKLQAIVNNELPVLQFSNRVQVGFSELNKLYQASLAETDPETLAEADQKALNMRLEFEVLRKRYHIDDALFDSMYDSYITYIDKTSHHTNAVLSKTLNYEEILQGYAEVSALRERYLDKQKSFSNLRYQKFESRLYQIDEDERFLVRFGLYLGIVLTLVLGIFSILIIRRIINAFNIAVHVAEEIAGGNLDEEIEIVSEDETGQLLHSLSTMRDVLKAQHEANTHREKEQTFTGGLNETMRGDKQLDELAHAIIRYLLEQLHAQVTAFYILDGKQLQRVAGMYYPPQSPECFPLDQTSLFADVALSKKPLLTSNLPSYYQYAERVGAMPNWLMLFPVLHEGRLQGMIEVAAFRRLGNDDVELMRRANNAIAVSVASVQSRFKLAQMLEQTQQQAEVLNVQRAELYQINSQLEEKNTVLDEQKNQILEKNSELEESRRAILEKSSALEVSGKYKSQFLSTMSHELRTPLNSILILSQALEENRFNNLNEREIEHAKIIHHAGSDLLNLINDILDLSKVEEGKMDVIIDEVNVHELAELWLGQFEFIAKEKFLQYSVKVEDDFPDVIYTDRQRLNQIVRNFISNALKFTDQGGVGVDIGFSYNEINEVDNLSVVFSVSDTGLGVEQSKQNIIFEAFKQADGTTSRKYGGTGLGLTISKELAQLLGGKITISSAGLGQGSVFAVTIPIGSAADITEVIPSAKAPMMLSDQSDGLAQHAIFKQVTLPKQVLFEDIVVCDPQLIYADIWKNIGSQYRQYIVTVNNMSQLQQYLQLKKPQALFLPEAMYLQLQRSTYTQISSVVVYLLPAAESSDSTQLLTEYVHPMTECTLASMSQLLDDIIYGHIRQHEKVLFVEDNPVFYPVISSLFQRSQLTVSIAEDGAEAMRMLSQHLYDYLVIDLNLPDYSGFDLIKAIRSLSSYSSKKVVLFTAEDLMYKEKIQLLSYADDVIFKSPQSISAICEDVLHVLAEKKKIRPAAANISRPIVKVDYIPGMLNGCTVLLIDDDERNLYSIGCALEAEGMTIFKASSGQQGLDLLNAEATIQLVLLDIMMPEMDGFEVLSIIRHQENLCHLPVFALTAKAMLGDRQICLDAGASDYFSKPVVMSDLLSGIAAYLIPLKH